MFDQVQTSTYIKYFIAIVSFEESKTKALKSFVRATEMRTQKIIIKTNNSVC